MRKRKKLLSLVLAVALTLSLSVTAFASWNQFQGSDGSRLQKTELSSGTAEWNICLSSYSLNVSQLSTPYIDGTNLYAAVTYYGALTPEGDVQLDTETVDSPFDIPEGTSTVTISGYYLPSDYRSMQIDTGIHTDLSGLTASAVLQDSTGYSYELGESKSYGGEFILYNTNGYRVRQADGYTLILTFHNNTGTVLESSGINLLVPSWELYKVNTTTGTKALAAYGRGQANSPITADTNNIYFGIYDGDHCFYQFPKTGTSVGNLVAYIPNDLEADFYNTGAAIVSVNGTDYAVFGCDNGKLYVRPTADFTNGSGNNISLTSTTGYPTGSVRSTIVVYNDSIYCSSKGETVGLIWRIPVAELLSSTPTVASNFVKDTRNSTSTPAISENGILYVGTSYFDEDFVGHGTVQAFNTSSLEHIARIYEGDAVQSSPVVHSQNDDVYENDYVYFTTNSATGAGQCYLLKKEIRSGSTAIEHCWTAGGTSANRYALQGFSADSGYLIYGDDGNRLYIMN